MAARQTRWIRAFVMHGRTQDGVIDYVDFFSQITQLPLPLTRVQIHRELVLVVNKIVVNSGVIDIRFASGNPEEIPMLYDEATGQMDPAETPDGTWLATATHATIIPADRLILIEGKRSGVGPTNLELYFPRLAKQNNLTSRLKFEISPVTSPSFEEELQRYQRIREAVIEISRPNTDWDDASDVLSELASESGGGRAQISVSAERGESLNKASGIIVLILNHVRHTLANVRNVRIIGRREGERKESSLTLTKHQLQTEVDVDSRVASAIEDEIVFAKQHELAEQARQLRRDRQLPGVGQ